MDYSTLIASAINFWPMQDATIDAIDVRGGETLLGTGDVASGLAGPNAWLPRSFNINEEGTLSRAAYVGAQGSVAHTVIGWFRRSGGPPLADPFFQIGVLGLGVVGAASMSASYNGVSNPTFNVGWNDQLWHLGMWSRSASGLIGTMAKDFTSFDYVSVATPIPGGLVQVGDTSISSSFRVAGLAVFNRKLTVGEFAVYFLGPQRRAPQSIVRGSGKIGRIGR